jgi:hypothetical protein
VAIGLSTLITPILALIPMPVLFGVFLFMGVSSLKGIQFFDRILLLFIPHKHQPDYIFLKYVPLMRVHLFTMVQVASLVGLWVIKSNSATSIAFPVIGRLRRWRRRTQKDKCLTLQRFFQVMLVLICSVRKLMECVFTRRELRVLDDLLPENPDKTSRRHGGLFNKIQRGADWDDEEAEAEKKRREMEEQEAILFKRGRAMTIELDEYGKVRLDCARTST